jgi:alkaline phosphatase D
MAVASCQHYETGYYAVHREIAASDIDLVLFLGDYIYETEAPSFAKVRQHPHVFPDDEAHYSLADYRLHHASYKLDADLRACHAAHPWLMVWDDHEVVNDYAGLTSPDLDEQRAFLRVRTAAYQAYFEHLPVSPSRAPVGATMRMNAHYQWGLLADIWTIDGRQFRDPHVCGGVHAPQGGRALWRCAAAEQPDRTLMGLEQEYWLAEGLASSERAWKFIAQPTQIAPGGIRTPLGPVVYADGWDAYPAARERLMAAIAQPRVPDVVCLGGDVHRHVAAMRFSRHAPSCSARRKVANASPLRGRAWRARPPQGLIALAASGSAPGFYNASWPDYRSSSTFSRRVRTPSSMPSTACWRKKALT